jgi:hypothetical protein
MKELIRSVLSKDSYLIVNKKLMYLFGTDTAILLSELIDKDRYFEKKTEDYDGWFFHLSKNIEQNIYLSAHKQNRSIRTLEQYSLIETKRQDLPAKQYFKINYDNLSLLLETASCKNSVEQVTKEFNNLLLKNLKTSRIIINNNTPNIITNKNNNKLSRSKKSGTASVRNEKYIYLAKRLARIVQFKKNIKVDGTKLNKWANSIRQLIETDGVSKDRIHKALIWYKKHYADDYVPVIESGQTLREKFLRLEAAITRSQIKQTESVPKRRTGYKSQQTLKYKKAEKV